MRGTAAVLAVLAVTALLVFWLRTAAVAPPPTPLPPAEVGAPAPAAPATSTPLPTVRSVPPATPPPDAPPPPPEFDPAELAALQGWLPAGELEVVALRGRAPVAGAQVRVWPAPATRLQDAGADGEPPLRQGTTGPDGRARFADVEAGKLAVRVDDGEQWRTASVVGNRAGRTRTVVVLFGDASIRGRAIDDAGLPLAGWRVYLARIGTEQGGSQCVTAADGGYAFVGLHSGRYHVQLEQRGTWSAARERMLTLAAGESARCDFGIAGVPGELRGRLVDAHGATVAGERPLRLVHDGHNDERRVRTDADGTFTAYLPAGRWHVCSDEHSGTNALATIDLGRYGTLDVPLPGIRLLGVVVATQPLDADDLRRSTYLLGRGGVQQADSAFVQDGQLHLQWLGLRAGDYVLQPQGTFGFVDAPRAGIEVSLHGDRPVHSLILKIEPR